MVKKRIHLKIEDVILLLIPVLFLLLFIIKPQELKKAPEQAETKFEFTGSDIIISVYHPNDNLIERVDLEEYLVGVVAAEMPPAFDTEALKAQAVAARTYALGRMKGFYGSLSNHFGADICTDPGHCQAWISKERFLEVYGTEVDWEKIQKAVDETKNFVITYEGTLINPLFHSNSGGVTEDVDEVWAVSGDVPYLTSVYSPNESAYPDYEKKEIFSWLDIQKRVKNKFPDATFAEEMTNDIEIEAYSASGRVLSIRIGNISIPGTTFRELFSLRSTNFEIAFTSSESIEVTTTGYGHGVGMSQCGADALAKEGYDYISILEYYYTGVNVGEMRQ